MINCGLDRRFVLCEIRNKFFFIIIGNPCAVQCVVCNNHDSMLADRSAIEMRQCRESGRPFTVLIISTGAGVGQKFHVGAESCR